MKPSLALAKHRDAIRQIVLSHRAFNPRVFGSVARGDDSDGSDLDLLVEPFPDTSLLDVACIQVELEALLGLSVDVVTPLFLSKSFRDQVVLEALPV